MCSRREILLYTSRLRMAGKKKIDDPRLLAAFEASLRETGSVIATARAIGITEDSARNLVGRHPDLRELLAPRGTFSRTHGMWETPEWRAWHSMRNRCNVPTSKDYERYGARGVRVCANWNSSAGAFLADMGQRPSLGHSLDRRDNDGHYSCGKCAECLANGWPANCRWATASEQAR